MSVSVPATSPPVSGLLFLSPNPAGDAMTAPLSILFADHELASTRPHRMDLRRLGALTRYASAAPLLMDRYEELRSRDRRITVRDVSASELIRVVWDDEDSE